MGDFYSTYYPFLKSMNGLSTPAVSINSRDQASSSKTNLSQLEHDVAKFSSYVDKNCDSLNNPVINKKKKSDSVGFVAATGAVSTIPLLKRIPTVAMAIQNGEIIKGTGKGIIEILNFSDDSSDTRTVLNTNWKELPKKFIDYYKTLLDKDKKITQTRFAFFKSTPVGRLAKKHPQLDALITKADKTLIDYKEVQNVINKLDKTAKFRFVDDAGREINPLNIPLPNGKEFIVGKNFMVDCGEVWIKGNFLTKILTKALTRTTRLNVLATLGLEVPAIVKSFQNHDGKNGVARGLISATGIIVGGSLLGALMPLGALGIIGLGIGGWLGGFAAKKINEKFFPQKQINKN